MIVFSIIKKSQLEGAHRLDAEYYQPEYLDIKEKLRGHPTLMDIALRITDFGAYSQMNFVEYTDEGPRFLRNQDIGEVFINNDEPIFTSLETYNRLSLKLEAQDIITPRVGTIGNAAIILKDNIPATANQNLAQIKPDKKKINPYYLVVFLCSKYGRSQFERAATGNVQPWLNLIQIKSLRVFIPSEREQKKFEDLVNNEVLIYFENSKSLYSQAEQILLEELGLQDFSVDAGLWSVVKFSEVKNAERIDADYFEPRYQKLFRAIKKRNAQTLGELVSIKKGIEPGSEAYTEEGKPFIRVSSISKEGIGDRVQKFLSEEMYQELKKDYEPKAGEVLLTKDASIGMACVVREPVEGIISGGILRLKIKGEVDADYLALCLNSIVGQYQAERDAGGSIIKHWKPSEIKKVLIPVLPKPTQQKIADLVRQSHAARKKARELLEEAKRTVERLIEEGGK